MKVILNVGHGGVKKRIHNKFRRYESVGSNKKGTGKILCSSSKEFLGKQLKNGFVTSHMRMSKKDF